MNERPVLIGSTEDVHTPDGRTLTISVAVVRSLPRQPVAVGHDAQARGAWWEQPEPAAVPHEVRVAERGDRFGGWRIEVASGQDTDRVVQVARAALLAGWHPGAGDPPGL